MYSEIFGKAWTIAWKHKILWLFGLLASCSGGTGFNFSFNFNSRTNVNITSGLGLPPDMERTFSNFANWVNYNWPIFLTLICGAILIVALISLALGTIGRAGVARGAWLADTGETDIHLSRVWNEGGHYFWRILGLGLLIGLPGVVFTLLPILLGVVALTGAAVEKAPALLGLTCLIIPLICVLIPLFWILGLLNELGTAAIVGENLGVFAAIGRAWRLFTKNLGSVILIGILIGIIGFIAGIVLSLPGIVLGLPLILAVLGGARLATGIVLLFILLFVIIYLPFSYLVTSVLRVYTGNLWVLAFRRLSQPAAPNVPVYGPPPPPASPFPPPAQYPPSSPLPPMQ